MDENAAAGMNSISAEGQETKDYGCKKGTMTHSLSSRHSLYHHQRRRCRHYHTDVVGPHNTGNSFELSHPELRINGFNLLW